MALVSNLALAGGGFLTPRSDQMVVDGSDVYFADNNGLHRYDVSSGTATLLVSEAPSGFAVDATNVYGVFLCEPVNQGVANSWLAVLPKTGGSWTTLAVQVGASAGAGASVSRFSVPKLTSLPLSDADDVAAFRDRARWLGIKQA
jgi:hypothetical protein